MSELADILELKPAASLSLRDRVALYAELSKSRIVGLVLFATFAGFCLALPGDASGWGWTLLHTLAGTTLVAAGANALNQVFESEHDRKMIRTMDRPLPSGRLSLLEAATFGTVCSVFAAIYLSVQVNFLAGALAALACASYVFVYTPLKRTTSACVLVGAVPGALPPVIGWAGAGGGLTIEAGILFAIVYFWQLPHFAAIAWQYREDYARAGYPMLPVVDPDGTRLNLHVITHMTALIAVSLLPVVYGMAGAYYAIGAALLGLGFLASSIVFLGARTKAAARAQVLVSVAYLPLILGLLLLDAR